MADAVESIQKIRTKPGVKASIEAHAEANVTSASEVARDLMDRYMGADVDAVERQRLSERLSIWVDPERWLAFKAAAKKRGHTLGEALEIAAEDVL